MTPNASLPLTAAVNAKQRDSPLAPGRLLTPDEVAERWSVGKSQVWRLVREGQLPAVRIGRYVRFRVADLEAWEQNGGSGV